MGIRITWADNNAGEEGHKVYRSNSPFDETTLPPVLVTLGPDITQYDDGTVVEGETYYYMVSAYIGALERFTSLLEIQATEDSAPQEGLVSFYSMDTVSGSTLPDEHGVYDGTIYDAVQVTGLVGQALQFSNSSNAYVALTDLGQSLVKGVSLWFRSDDTGPVRLLLSHRTKNVENQIYLRINSGVLEFWYGPQIVCSTTFLASTWYHVVFNFEAGHQEGFIDKASVGSDNKSPSSTADDSFVLGNYAPSLNTPNSGEGFNGKIDLVRFYDRVLDAADINSLYNEGAAGL